MNKHMDRRRLLQAAAGSALGVMAAAAGAQSFPYKPQQRYPTRRC